MDQEFWLQRWERQELGWQQDEVNPLLQQYFPALVGCQQLLVPLCGASPDLWWLSERTAVVGAELSELACQMLFRDAKVQPDSQLVAEHHLHKHQQLALWQGDFFALNSERIGPIDAIYDRAALIALPPQMRNAYVAKLRELCPAGRLLLLSLEYPQAEKQGPPFSVDAAEVASLFADCQRQLLSRRDISAQGFGRRKMKASRLDEVVWLIQWS